VPKSRRKEEVEGERKRREKDGDGFAQLSPGKAISPFFSLEEKDNKGKKRGGGGGDGGCGLR